MALGRVGPTAASFFAARSSTTRTPSSCPASSTCMRISTSPDGRSGRASAPAQEPPPQLVHDVLKKYAGMKGPPTFHFQIETREKHYWVTHQTSDGAGGGGDGRACRWRWWRAVASVEGSEIGGKCRMTSREAEGKIVHTHVLDGQIQLRWDVRAHLDGNGGNRIGVLNMLSVFCTKLFPICSMFSSYAIIHHICIARLCALICFHVCSMRISLHFVKHGCVSFSLAHNS